MFIKYKPTIQSPILQFTPWVTVDRACSRFRSCFLMCKMQKREQTGSCLLEKRQSGAVKSMDPTLTGCVNLNQRSSASHLESETPACAGWGRDWREYL